MQGNRNLIFLLFFVFQIINAQSEDNLYEVVYNKSNKTLYGNSLTSELSVVLTFNDSVYKYRNTVKDSIDNWQYKIPGFKENVLGSYTIGNLKKNKQFHVRKSCLNSGKVIVVDSIPKIQWTIHKDKKQILNLECIKATGIYRGRPIVAYFTESIPMAVGPYKILGLPGLILEMNSTDGDFIYTAVSLKSNVKLSTNFFKIPTDLYRMTSYRSELACIEKRSSNRLKIARARMLNKVKEYNKSFINEQISEDVKAVSNVNSLELIYEWETEDEEKK